MIKKEFYKLGDVSQSLTDLRNKGYVKGKSTGLFSLDENITLVKGYPFFVAGSPGSGKTEFVLEVLINTSKKYGWKHFIYVGENGETRDIFAELCFKYAGKSYIKGYPNSLDEKEAVSVEYFINEHFVVVNAEFDYTIDDFYKSCERAEKEYNVKFDTTLFDPFNDIIDESDLHKGRDDKWLNVALKTVRNSSKNNKRIDFIIEHVSDPAPEKDKDTNNWFTRPAKASEWAKGKTWHRRGFMMVLIYRPPIFLTDKNGRNYDENETLVIIQKAKPKGAGKIGTMSIWFNKTKNKFYYKDSYGNELYGCETSKDTLYKPQSEAISNYQLDNPF